MSDTRKRTAANEPEIKATKLVMRAVHQGIYLEICAVFSFGN